MQPAPVIIMLIIIGISFGSEGTASKVSRAASTLNKIVGGEAAEYGQVPYQIALYYQDSILICGGSFIQIKERHFVLTAAHCMQDGSDPSSYKVVAGEVNEVMPANITGSLQGTAQLRLVTHWAAHENYEPTTVFNDIALLALEKPFQINKLVSPIRLPKTWERIGPYGVVSGWGLLSESSEYATVLHSAIIPILNDRSCANVYDNYVASTMICAGSSSGVCEGLQVYGILVDRIPNTCLIMYLTFH